MKELFLKLIEEAKEGKVNFDGEEWPIGFSTIIEQEKYVSNEYFPILHIKNQEQFFSLLEEYIKIELNQNRKTISFIKEKEENQKKILMAYLFVNATTNDFENPICLLKRTIYFLEDKTFDKFSKKVLVNLEEISCFLEINNKKQSVLMETPNKMEFSFTNNDCKYNLPSISYGIENINGEKTCYIYSILNPKKKTNESEEKFYKKINRKLYKLNDKVQDDYDLENIKDVSMSSIISLNIFLTILKNENIVNIRFVPYLPLRYQSREITSKNNPSLEKELEDRNNFIQMNATNKFIRTVRRVLYHRNDFEITSYPYEIDDFLHIKSIQIEEKINNSLLEEVTKKSK